MSENYVIVRDGKKVSSAMPKELAEKEVEIRNNLLTESKDQGSRYEIRPVLLG
jgi:hypothetical protein